MKIVATVSSLQEIRLADRADVIEVRLDLFQFPSSDVRAVTGNKDIIATFRRVEDGGRYSGDDVERIRVLRRFVEESESEYVDLECDLPDRVFDFNCTIIESYHNFRETPEYSELRAIVENRRGDIVKIVTMGKSKEDVLKVVRLLTEFENVVSFLMGERYSFTRLLSAFLGSPLIYCYVREPKAPGQIHVDDAYRILKMMGW